MTALRPLLFPLALAALATACTPRVPDLPKVDAAAYEDTIAKFHAVRLAAIAGPEGWATLVGLWWLKPGENRIGSDTALELVLPANRSPRRLASLFVEGDSVRLVAAPGAAITADSQPLRGSIRLHSDIEPKETVIATGSLTARFLERSGKLAFRVKDTLHPVRTAFPGLHYFPADTAWRIQARFVARARADSMNIISVLGTETRMAWPGELRFRVHGREYRLQVIREPEDHSKNMFVMFRDSTNGRETYPAMRYTYVAPPDSLGRTVLDFNKSYNPPCAFTAFATCPLPPRGNELPFRVPAGELKPAGH
jgi:uncharacterized protein (DUF1684 family)